MPKTELLPPITAVKLLWGATRGFSNESIKDAYEEIIHLQLESLSKLAEKNHKEILYLRHAGIQLMASLRNAGIVYKGRQLNYAENKELRQAYLDSLKERHEFSKQVKDVLNNLPAVSVGGVGGLAAFNFLEISADKPVLLIQFFVALASGFAGFFIRKGYLIISQSRKHMNYIRKDYETTTYFLDYLERMERVMLKLYDNIETVHLKVFGKKYSDGTNHNDTIRNLVMESLPPRCKYLDKHMQQGKIKPDLWYMCETGIYAEERCKHYPKNSSGQDNG